MNTREAMTEHRNDYEWHTMGKDEYGILRLILVPQHRQESCIPKTLVELSNIGSYFERIKCEFSDLMKNKAQFEQFELVHTFFLEGEVNDLKDNIYYAKENNGFNFKHYAMEWEEYALKKDKYIKKVKTQAEYTGKYLFPEYRGLYDAFALEYERVANELCCLFMESQGLTDLANEPIEIRECFNCEYNHALFLKRLKEKYHCGERGAIMASVTEVGFIVTEGIWPKHKQKLLRSYLKGKGYIWTNGTWDARFRNHVDVKTELRQIYKIPPKHT